jgi:hypothetical protein
MILLPDARKKALLFEKRSKNVCHFARALPQRATQNSKSFFVLFFKKEPLPAPNVWPT